MKLTAQEMLYHFRLKANRLDNKSGTDLSIPQQVHFLNMGMMQLLKNRYGINNNYRAGLESIQKRIDEWQVLVVVHERLTEPSSKENRYSFDLTKTEKEYLFLLRASFKAEKEDCAGTLVSFPTESDDLNVLLDNPNANPNFDWRETLHRISENEIIAYSDNTFTISEADIDYLRYPRSIDAAGYVKEDGTAAQNVDCELPGFLHDDVIDEAVTIYKFGLNHPGAQAAAAMKQMNE